MEGYEGVVCQCHNCGNYSGHVIKSNPWFTFCFIVRRPLTPKRAPLSQLMSALSLIVLATCMRLAGDSALNTRLRGYRLQHLQLCTTSAESS